jgi:hypothetical protein
MKTTSKTKEFVFHLQCEPSFMENNNVALADLEKRICEAGGVITGKTVALEEGLFIANIWVDAQPAKEFWQKFVSSNDRYRGPLERLIVIREGRYGWDDYQLLYHYDKSQETDELLE